MSIVIPRGILAVALMVPLQAGAQPGPPLPSNWKAVESIPAGSRVAVRLHSGQKIDGRVAGASEGALVVADGRGRQRLERDTISRVYRLTSRQRRRTLIGMAIGAGIGLVTGAAFYRRGDFEPTVVPAFGLIGSGTGALAGALAGLRRHQVLVYAASPAP